MNGNEFGLYIHIPFCTKKCDYCHFYVIPEKEAWKERLTDVLLRHWQQWQQEQHILKQIRTLYFGGGTPALMGPARLEKIIKTLLPSLASDAEITLEANPENLSDAELKGFRDVGINRLSLGVQTLDETLLPLLGRTHTATTAIKAVERSANFFKNISIDLMYDLPDQSLNSWGKTLARAVALPITHLSLYNLTIEPHTAFYKRRDKLILPTANASADMYNMAVDCFAENGLEPYEISAFCRDGYRSKHNLGYWQGIPFLGIGPSAYSYINGSRFRCHSHFNRYCTSIDEGTSPYDFEETLDAQASLRERFVIALRLVEGVELKQLEALQEETHDEVSKLITQNLLIVDQNRVKMTSKGIRFYDTIAAALI